MHFQARRHYLHEQGAAFDVLQFPTLPHIQPINSENIRITVTVALSSYDSYEKNVILPPKIDGYRSSPSQGDNFFWDDDDELAAQKKEADLPDKNPYALHEVSIACVMELCHSCAIV